MAPVNKATSDQASRDRNMRLRVRSGPIISSSNSARNLMATSDNNNTNDGTVNTIRPDGSLFSSAGSVVASFYDNTNDGAVNTIGLNSLFPSSASNVVATNTDDDNNETINTVVPNGLLPSSTGSIVAPNNGNDSETVSSMKGPTDELFTVILNKQTVIPIKKSLLDGVPAFAVMCNGKFLEGHTKIINLEEDVETFRFLLEYLQNSEHVIPESMKASGQYPEKLASLYVLANKYGVEALENTIVDAFIGYYFERDFIGKRGVDLSIRFLDIGLTVYESVPGIGDVFKMWFRGMITHVLKDATGEVMDRVFEVVYEDPDLAVDVTRALAEIWKAEAATVKTIRRLVSGPSIY